MPRPRTVGITAAVVLVLLVVGLVIALPLIVRRVAVDRLTQMTGRTVSLHAVGLNLFTGRVALDRFRIAQRGSTDPALELEGLEVRVSIPSLLTNHARVKSLTITAPRLHVARLTETEFDFSDLLALIPPADPNAKPSTRTISIDRIVLSSGAVMARDDVTKTSWKLEDLTIDGASLTTREAPPGRLTMKVKLNGTPIALDAPAVDLAKGVVAARATVEGFDIAQVRPFVPPTVGASPVGGRVTVAFDVKAEKATPSPRVSIAGDVRLDDVALLMANASDPFVKVGRITVKIKEAQPLAGVVTLETITIEGADVKVKRDAQGRIDVLALAQPPASAASPRPGRPRPTRRSGPSNVHGPRERSGAARDDGDAERRDREDVAAAERRDRDGEGRRVAGRDPAGVRRGDRATGRGPARGEGQRDAAAGDRRLHDVDARRADHAVPGVHPDSRARGGHVQRREPPAHLDGGRQARDGGVAGQELGRGPGAARADGDGGAGEDRARGDRRDRLHASGPRGREDDHGDEAPVPHRARRARGHEPEKALRRRDATDHDHAHDGPRDAGRAAAGGRADPRAQDADAARDRGDRDRGRGRALPRPHDQARVLGDAHAARGARGRALEPARPAREARRAGDRRRRLGPGSQGRDRAVRRALRRRAGRDAPVHAADREPLRRHGDRVDHREGDAHDAIPLHGRAQPAHRDATRSSSRTCTWHARAPTTRSSGASGCRSA